MRQNIVWPCDLLTVIANTKRIGNFVASDECFASVAWFVKKKKKRIRLVVLQLTN